MKLGFQVEVVSGDALTYPSDLFVTKYSPRSGGIDRQVISRLAKEGIQGDLKPRLGHSVLVDKPQSVSHAPILIVGAVSVFELGYSNLKILGADMLRNAESQGFKGSHLHTTLHGINNAARGNDEVEAFRALLLGFADAYHNGTYPNSLEKITIVERESHRAALMQDALTRFMYSDTSSETRARRAVEDTTPKPNNIINTNAQDIADEDAPHIFVAMPFAEQFDDIYYLAIRPAIEACGFLCIRLDQDESAFTGDIMDQVRAQIDSASFVVALLDTANPNVYLEVGYAWGVDTPAILILKDGDPVPFDVRGSRLLLYKQMHKLKTQLQQEINNLTD